MTSRDELSRWAAAYLVAVLRQDDDGAKILLATLDAADFIEAPRVIADTCAAFIESNADRQRWIDTLAAWLAREAV